MMKMKMTMILAMMSLCAAWLPARAAVSVTNVAAQQIEGTKTVAITYDVSSDATNAVTVSLAVSNDAAAVACPSVSGDVGAGVPTGTGKSMVWDAGADWNGNVTTLVYTVVADEAPGGAPVPDDFVLVEAGTAAGGSPTISDDFYIAKYEVTKNLWDEVAGWADDNGYDISPGGGGGSGNYPVVYVTWYECVKWCNAWSEKTGRSPAYTVGGVVYRTGNQNNVDGDFSAGGFHLPTDEQWEYAARGGKDGNDTEYSGSDTIGDVAWYIGNSGGQSHEVGSKAANELGTFDMSGNVWEWCHDWSPGFEGSLRVQRGGSWPSPASLCGVWRPDAYPPDYNDHHSGFRLACPAESDSAPARATALSSVDTRDYTLTVAPDRGNPDPAAGANTYAWRASVTASVDTAATDGGTNYTCTGSTNTTGNIILTNLLSSIAWQWEADAPSSHTVTLHPGEHGSIAEANSGVDYVVSVTNGVPFPAVTVVADTNWTFVGWNPTAPATITNDFEATATYETTTVYHVAEDIPMDYDNWFVKFDGNHEITLDGIKANGCGYRRGNEIVSKQLYDFRDSHTFMKFQVNGGGSYSRFYAWLYYVAINRTLTTGHSYEGSRVVSSGTWLYVHHYVDTNGNYTSVTSLDDYDIQGGTVLDTNTGNWADYHGSTLMADMVRQGQIDFEFDDTYGGTAAYVVAAEARTTARPLELHASQVYDFEDGVMPTVFSNTPNVVITNSDRGGKCIFIPDDPGAALKIDDPGVIAVGHDIRAEFFGNNHYSSQIRLDSEGESFHTIGANDGLVDNWIRQDALSFPEATNPATSGWFAHPDSDGGNGTFLDNIVLYRRVPTMELVDDFESYSTGALGGQGDWVTLSSPSPSIMLVGSNKLARSTSAAYGNGVAKPYPFRFNTNQSAAIVQYTANIRETSGGNNVAASLYLRSNIENSTNLLYLAMGSAGGATPRLGVGSDNMSTLQGADGFPKNTYFEIRWTLDWTHVCSDGRYGKASVQYREVGADTWVRDTILQDVEVHVDDPAALAFIQLRMDGIGGRLGEIDDIYVAYDRESLSAPTHLVTLHPGEHGSIAEANSGVDYVVSVTNGAPFPAVTVVADTNWTFVGWNPTAPATITNDFEATAVYSGDIVQNWDFVEYPGSGNIPTHWEQYGDGSPTFLATFEGRTAVMDISNSRPAEGLYQTISGVHASDIESIRISFYLSYASLVGDGWYGDESPINFFLYFEDESSNEVRIARYYNYTSDGDSASNPNFELVDRYSWIDRSYAIGDLGISSNWVLKKVVFSADGWTDTSYVDYVRVIGRQSSEPNTTHLITLHPGDHGSIAEANAGVDYVVTVTNGEPFPAVTVVADTNWAFVGWNPAAPVVMTNDFEATATYSSTVVFVSLDVFSEHGDPDPSVGTHAYPEGSALDCSVGSPFVAGATQYVCAGWTGTGDVPATGTDTHVSFSLTQTSSLSWAWTTNYWLGIEVLGNGSVDVADDWQAAGTTVVVTATADEGYRFLLWEGDTNGCPVADNAITAPMSQPRTLRAFFVTTGVTDRVIEDFELGDFNPLLAWRHSGNASWAVQSNTVYAGDFAAEAPVSIGDNQSASMEIDVHVPVGGEVSFRYKVSSESNYDYLRFYVDGEQKGAWSGGVDWSLFTLELGAGDHVLSWRYTKDGSVSSGSDTAWIDDIVVTGMAPPSEWIGFGLAQQAVAEADGSADVPVVVSSVQSSDVSAVLGIDPSSTAVAGTNFTIQVGGSVADNGDGTYTVTVPAGQTGTVVSVSITDNSATDGDKTLVLTLTNAVNIELLSGTHTLMIADDEAPAYVWTRNLLSGWCNSGNRVFQNPIDGYMYIAGHFTHSIDFDPGSGTDSKSSSAFRDWYLWKLTTDGLYGPESWTLTGHGGSVNDALLDMAFDSSNRVYICGQQDRGSYPSDWDSNIYVGRYGQDRAVDWSHWLGNNADSSRAHAIELSPDETHVYVVGYFGSAFDFDPSSGDNVMTPYGGRDVFVMKLTVDGSLVWTRQLGGTGNDYANSLALDRDGHLYLSGSFEDAADFDPGTGIVTRVANGASDAFICKLDEDGQFEWVRAFGGTGTDAGASHDALLVEGDAVYCAGYFQNEADFGLGLAADARTSAGGYDAFLVGLTTDGQKLWARTFGGAGDDTGEGLAHQAGTLYLTGRFQGDVDLDPTDGSDMHNGPGNQNMYFSAFDLSGGYLWAETVGSDSGQIRGYGIGLDALGDIYITGSFDGTVDFDSGPGEYRVSDPAVDSSMYLSKFHPPTPQTNIPLVVVTSHGTATPAIGRHSYAPGAELSCSIDSPVVQDGRRHTCTGWTGMGSVPAEGLTTQTGPFSLTEASSITWRWSTECRLEADVIGSGSLDISNGWFSALSNVVVTAIPAPHNVFVAWSGDLTDATVDGPAVTLPMDRPRAVTATFAVTTFEVAFDLGSNGMHMGGGALTQLVAYAGSAEAPLVEPQVGWQFTGWNAAFTHVTTNLTIHALYERASVNLAVYSSQGIATPPVGTNVVTWGEAVALSVTSPDEQGSTQFVCSGWSGTGSVPASGIGADAGAIAVTNDSSIVWLWNTNYLLDTEVSGNGTVDVGDGWHALGSQVTVQAAPTAAHHHFARWEGDTAGCTVQGSSIDVLMNRARAITAVFTGETFLVHFDLGAQGWRTGGGVLNQWIAYGQSAVAPQVQAYEGWIFDGWNGDFNHVISNATVTARYIKEEAPQIDVELVALTGPSAFDTSTNLPVSRSGFTEGSEVCVEIWMRNVDGSVNGITGGSLDFNFDPILLTATNLSHGGVYTVLPSGVFDNETGLVDNLSGNAQPGVTDKGDDEWVRLGYVQFISAGQGSCALTAAAGLDSFARAGEGAIGWHRVELNNPLISLTFGTNGCPYDVDGNGIIGNGDYSFLSAAWHSEPGGNGWDPRVDFDGDGYVGNADYSWLSTYWHYNADDPRITIPAGPDAVTSTMAGRKSRAVSGIMAEASNARIDVELVPLADPSATDAATNLPSAVTAFTLNDIFYLEIWAKSIDGSPNGITGANLDILFETSLVAAGGIQHGDIYTVLTSGSFSNEIGLVDNLGGNANPGVTDMGDDEWVRIGLVAFLAKDIGTAVFTSAAGLDSFARAAEGSLAWADVELNNPVCEVEIFLPADVHRVAYEQGAHGEMIDSTPRIQFIGHGGIATNPAIRPDAGWRFTTWQITPIWASLDNITTSILAVADYYEYDIDRDMIDDEWEGEHFGSRAACVVGTDSDGDGQDNLSEYIADTNPTNPASFFCIGGFGVNGGGFQASWPASTGRVYTIDWRESLVEGTWAYFTNFHGTNINTDLLHSGTPTSGFYRVRVGLE